MCLIWYPSENLPVFAIRDQNKWNSDNGIKYLLVSRRNNGQKSELLGASEQNIEKGFIKS
jgi:hypothetical protein